ncbi:MAG TPA: hypothetical protein DDY41_07575 [Arthrobacter bacterium]|jgi:hypothetical protein|nr:hypothetical protein [Arthrobacter sp.]
MGKKFVAPENLQDLDASALEASVSDAFAAYDELKPKDGEDVSDEALAELSAIKDFVSAAKAENSTREQAAAARAEQLAAIETEMSAGSEAPAEEAEAGAEGEFAKNPFPPKGDGDAEDIADGGDDEDTEDKNGKKLPPKAPVQKASIKAPANLSRGSYAAKAAKAAPASQAPSAAAEGGRLLSATSAEGYQMGQAFASLEEAGDLIAKRLSRLPKDAPAGTLVQNTALQIALPSNPFSQNAAEFANMDRDAFKLLMAAGDETRLTGKSLVAAGGWGAPSERSLDFCHLESIEGLISLPEVAITRGGIQYTKGPVFADVLANSTGFWDMTEATAEAGVELKTSLRPTIPTFIEQRLDAVGVMMEAGLLLRQGWPEVIARYSELLLTAHQYKLAQKKMTQIQAFTGAAVAAGPGFGNALDILHILELVATGERQRRFMSPKQTLEALIPYWVKNVIRVDLANRAAVDSVSVTDAQIDAHFTARMIKVQWITAEQPLVIDPIKNIALKYNDTVEVIMYPAGTYVAGVAPVITMDTIYDSTNLKKNDYVELFVEQGVLVTNPCGFGVRVSLTLYANGRRATDSIANNFGA